MSQARLAARVTRHWVKRKRDDFFDIVKLKLFVTRRCNLKCVHCGIGEAEHTGDSDLTTDQVLELWRHNPRLEILSLSGGEPFIRPDMTTIGLGAVEHIPGMHALTVNTNGWYTEETIDFSKQVLDALRGEQRLFIAVSSDGPPDVHAKIRGDNESYERKEETLARLRELPGAGERLQIRHNVNVNRWNLDVAIQYINEREAAGEQCMVSLYSFSKHYDHQSKHKKERVAFREQMHEQHQVLETLKQRRSFLGNRFMTLAQKYYEQPQRTQPVPCFSLRASAIIEQDGMVRPCINFPANIGKVQDNGYDLSAILSGDKSNKLRETIRLEKCPICWTPNEAYVTMMCNLPNPDLWREPVGAVRSARFFKR